MTCLSLAFQEHKRKIMGKEETIFYEIIVENVSEPIERTTTNARSSENCQQNSLKKICI